MLNAFCRVAPSVRFSALAILPAGFLLFARDFSVRVSSVVQARRLDIFFAIKKTPVFLNENAVPAEISNVKPRLFELRAGEKRGFHLCFLCNRYPVSS
jgi:hypothetical protein